ncbi:hypothetical protein PG994_004349 [Apiospora phragmitis]|uniref:WW domain-containing protein n=1 Tax=Apiospora phragmitis TaxID=2905665 RepID=A0ABR1VQC5_9PEZI
MHLRIIHTALPTSPDSHGGLPGPRVLSDIRRGLPIPWLACETLEGPIVFFNDVTHETSWSHPDGPTTTTLGDSLPESRVQFEALSYTWGSPEDPKVAYVQEDGEYGGEKVCGVHALPWRLFRRAVLCIQMKKAVLPHQPLMSRLMQVRNLVDCAVQLSLPRLPRLTRRHRDRLCGDPRDKVYGILSTTTLALRARITPQYSNTVNQVYRDTFLAHYEVTQRLELFTDCSLRTCPPGWPSWVPQWHSMANHGQPFRLMFASGLSRAEAQFIHFDILRATGVQCAVIASVSQAAESQDPRDILEAIRSWANIPDFGSGGYVTGENEMEAFATVLCGHRTRERYPRLHSSPTVPELSKMVRDEILHTSRKDDLAENRNLTGILELVRDKTFIQSAEGYFGLGPEDSQVGDIICVLLGTHLPLVLRPSSPDGTGTFRLVGECCLHGLHDATSLLGPLPPGWRVQAAFDASGLARYSYYDSATGTALEDDPRLPALGDGDGGARYERVDLERTADDPIVTTRFRDRKSGGCKKDYGGPDLIYLGNHQNRGVIGIPDFSHQLINLEDCGLLHVAALTLPDVAGERILAGGAAFTYNDILDAMREMDPSRALPERSDFRCAEVKATLEQTRFKELLARLGKPEPTGFVESIRQAITTGEALPI